MWLAEKRSHSQFQGLSLVKITVCVFPYPLRSRGACHLCVEFVKSGILPIYDKPWWQTPIFATYTFTLPQYIGAHIRQTPVTNSVQFDLSDLGGICHMWGDFSYKGGVCQIWAPIYWDSVKVYVANNFKYDFLYWSRPFKKKSIWGREVPIFDKSKWKTLTEYFSKGDPLQLLKGWNRAL